MKLSKSFIPDAKWVKNKISIRKSLNFNPKNDFLIIPEIWAHFANDLELQKKELIMEYLFRVFITCYQQTIFIK